MGEYKRRWPPSAARRRKTPGRVVLVQPGRRFVTLHRYQEALDPLERALALNSQHIESWAKKGQALRRLGRFKEAVAAYDSALAVDPHYAWAWNGRGLALESLDRREEALASFERAVSEDPTGLWYYTNQLDPLLELRATIAR
jgi:tetratricopeptide (TPR) repeat protein